MIALTVATKVLDPPRSPAVSIPAATEPRPDPESDRMLVVDADRDTFEDARFGELVSWIGAGDLVVLNDAATVPASLHGRTARGEELELRLLAWRGGARWSAVLFGAGDWRTPTEHRPAPPRVERGARLVLTSAQISASIERIGERHPRLVEVRLDREGLAMWTALFHAGRPVQYAYMTRDLTIAEAQTPWATRPWSVEMPSAGRPLTRAMLLALRAHGAEVAFLTHSAGLSSTGDAALDAVLPLPERYDLPRATIDAIAGARARGGSVVAIGTTVVRALEGNALAHGGSLVAGEHETDLRIDASHERRIVDTIVTNVHGPGESHFELLTSFAPRELLDRAASHAARSGYLAHELGDAMLVRGARAPSR